MDRRPGAGFNDTLNLRQSISRYVKELKPVVDPGRYATWKAVAELANLRQLSQNLRAIESRPWCGIRAAAGPPRTEEEEKVLPRKLMTSVFVLGISPSFCQEGETRKAAPHAQRIIYRRMAAGWPANCKRGRTVGGDREKGRFAQREMVFFRGEG